MGGKVSSGEKMFQKSTTAHWVKNRNTKPKETGLITCFVIFWFGLDPLSFPPQVLGAAEK